MTELGIHDLSVFIISGLLLNIAPGPDSLLIMTRSATQGWRAGCAAALGIGAGTLVHVSAAALGLSALLVASATAFTVVKIVGAAYLCYLGVQMLLSRERNASASAAPVPAMPYRRIFAQGFLTNVLNPKVALFFLAFVPQFIAVDSQHKALAFALLGLLFDANSMLWCNFLAVFTAFAGARVTASAAFARWLNRGIGALFLALGVRLALSERA